MRPRLFSPTDVWSVLSVLTHCRRVSLGRAHVREPALAVGGVLVSENVVALGLRVQAIV